MIFPYLGGMQFVQALQAQDGGSWKLVDLADRVRVPESTEQILHPEKWVQVEGPLPVRLDVQLGAGGAAWRAGPGASGRRASCSTATATRPRQAGAATATSSGSAARAPPPPCRDDDVLVMKWRWDSERDADEFEAALRASAVARGAAVQRAGDTVTFVLAGDQALARRIASERLAPAELGSVGALRRRPVDDVVEAVVDLGEHLRLLRLGQVAVLDGLVELGRQPSPSARPSGRRRPCSAPWRRRRATCRPASCSRSCASVRPR